MHLSRPLEMSLSLALREARGRRHEFLTVEHVLYALLHDEAVAEVVRACGGDVDALKQELATYLDERLERLPPDSEASPERTLGFQRILQRAAAHVQSSGKEELDGRHVLVAIFRETDSHAAYLLAKQGITRL
ncbi:MAG: ATP-dependent Clp protease ATP-binding subunit ClpA, partial [Deltaproteobacteria bacterium]